jgi:hypothetical protein
MVAGQPAGALDGPATSPSTPQPLPALGGRFPWSSRPLADGSVRSVDRNTPEATLKLYIQKADGMPFPEL